MTDCRNTYPLWIDGRMHRTCCQAHWMQPVEPVTKAGAR